MALPSERREGNDERIAYGVMLRLLAVGLAFGVPQLVTVGLRWSIVSVAPMGDGTGLFTGLIELFRPFEPVGETWALLFFLTAVFTVALDGLLIGWALRRGARRDEPWLLLGLGLAGVLARGLAYWANIGVTMDLGRAGGPEALGAFVIASNIAGIAHTALFWTLAVCALVFALIGVLKRRDELSRDGPYREPGDISVPLSSDP